MTLYVESSALLAWLLDETPAERILDLLREADGIVTSELTLIECDRVFRRVRQMDPGRRGLMDAVEAHLIASAADWSIESIAAPVVDRARQPFPDDTIRSLDAIHLATALVIRATLGDLDVLSLDERIRSNARALGFRVLPD